jgi:hypothetical protein
VVALRARGRTRLAVAAVLALLAPLVFPIAASAATAPAITSANNTTFINGTLGSFTVTATGSPTPTLTETGTLPTGVTFVDNGNATATLSGTASSTASYTLTITAHNTTAPDATQTFTVTVTQPWYNNTWLYRKTITIDHTKVGANLTNFPLLVSVADAGLAANAQSTGNDILFTASDGVTKLNHQIESYTSGTGTLVAWVDVTSVSSTVNTVVYLYYGNASAANQQNASAVWDANYKGVWHFNQNPTGSSNDIPDSTTNANQGSSQGAMTSANQVTGLAGGSLSFNGSTNYVSTTTSSTTPQVYTEEAWIKTSSVSGHKILGFEGAQTGTAAANWNLNMYIGTDGQAYAGVFNTAFPASIATYTTPVNDNAWHDIVASYDSGTTTVSLYVDGTLRGTASAAAAQSATGYWRMGSYKLSGWSNGGGTDGFFTGTIDEVRVSNNARAAGWISTEYNNESAPSTFVSLGSQQPFVPVAPTITSANNTTFTNGAAGTFTVTATGSPTPTLTATGALPTGVTFVDNGNATATIAGTPSTSGSYVLTITAHNTATPDATQTFYLTVGTSWYDTHWLYRKAITIDHTKVGAALTNFPALISLTDAGLAAHAQSTGNDILFTSSDGSTKLNHEIESFTVGTGVLVAWVDIPSLSNTVDTVIYLYYGNAAATNQQNATGVWDANYQGVWHFMENPAGTQPAMKDSTSVAGNGTANGTWTSGQQVAGKIGGTLNFNGSNDRVVGTDIADGVSALTVELWINLNSVSGVFVPIAKSATASPSSTMAWALAANSTTLNFDLGTGGATATTLAYSTAIGTGGWVHFALVYTGAAMGIYYQGTLVASTAKSGTINNITNPVVIGNIRDNATDTDLVNGKIDEPRVSNIARSAGWITTEYNNENAPSTFVTVGSEQGLAAPTITSANNTTFSAGSADTFTVTTTGGPTPSLAETGALPSGVTFVNNGDGTATLAGTPTTTGTYTLTITAHNTAGADATQTFTLTVTQPWYNAAWLYRKAITIDHTKVSSTLTNFPVLVSFTDAAVAAKAQSTGNDLLFTAADSVTKLNHQIESYTSGTGTLVAWVDVPSVSSTVDTVIYLYYGDASATNQQNASAVWDANYKGVWHLSEGPTGTAPQFKDSTSNTDNGTAQGSIAAGAQVAGKIDGSLTLDGTANYISTTNNATVPNNVTVQVWFKTTVASGKKIISYEDAQTGTAGSNYDRMLWVGTDGKLRFAMYDGTVRIAVSTATVTDGAWHQAVGVEDNTAHLLTLYLDGVAVSIATGTTPQSYTGWWRIGSYAIATAAGYTASAAGYFPGSVDEARVSTAVRAAGWITTDYANQNSPSTFSTLGTEQAPPAITSANNTTFTAGTAGTFTITATGTPTPTLTETGTLPTGITFVDNGNSTATLAGTATLANTYTLTITAHSTFGTDATQTFTLTIAAGSLSISVPATANLGSGTLGSTTSGQLGSVQVIDNRGSPTATWTVTVTTTTLTFSGRTVPLANLQYWSGPTPATTGTATFTPGQANAGSKQDLTTGRTAFTMTAGNGTNSATWNPTIVVTVPLTVIPGGFTGTITHSVA